MVNRKMAVTLFVVGLIVALVIAIFAFRPRMTLVDALAQKITNPGESSKEVLRSLANCIDKCSRKERELARQMVASIEAFDKADKAGNGMAVAYQKFYGEIVPVYQAMIQHYDEKGELANLMKIYEAALLQIATSRAVGFMHPLFNQTVFSGIEQMVSRYNTSARAHGLRGSALSLQGVPTETVLDEYVKCLKIDAQDEICQRGYRVYSQEYVKPRCEGPSLKPVFTAYIGAKQRSGTFTRPVTMDKEQLYLQKDPILTRAHFRNIFPDGADASKRPQFRIELTNDGTNLLAAMTEKFRGHYLVIMYNGQPVIAPYIAERVLTPNLTGYSAKANQDPAQAFKEICDKPVEPPLPPHLKI